LTLIIDMF